MTESRPFDWGASSIPYHGERHSGDKWLVTAYTGGALVALVDALGHGDHAADAADAATRTLERHARESPVALIEKCHADMRAVTRGAAISVASFDWHRRTMTWLGIGNVAGILLQPSPDLSPRAIRLLVRGGVVGYHLPDLQPAIFPLAGGATLIMTTDGVRSDFSDTLLSIMMEPQRQAERILDGYARPDDDATVLVFRCNGDA